VRAPARPTSAVAIACLLLGAACGTAEREADIAAVVDGFHAALEERDGAGACARLNARTAAALERQEKRPCEQAILGLRLPAGARASSAEVYVTSGYTELGEGGAAFLDEGPEGWRISAAGCTSRTGDQPYECELED
jgi:hypothetical protein